MMVQHWGSRDARPSSASVGRVSLGRATVLEGISLARPLARWRGAGALAYARRGCKKRGASQSARGTPRTARAVGLRSVAIGGGRYLANGQRFSSRADPPWG